MRKVLILPALTLIVTLGMASVASASPTVTFKARAVPIPGFRHTGNILEQALPCRSNIRSEAPNTGAFHRH